MAHDTILILDFGSQVTQLIARRVRDAKVYCEVHPCSVSGEWLKKIAAENALKGIILSGSHASAYAENTDRAPEEVFALGVPVLGICYGMQTMAQQLGGQVESGPQGEFGRAHISVQAGRLLDGLGAQLDVWMSHGDHVSRLPPGFAVMASTEGCPIAAMADEARRFYGLQFHPEVTHTPQGEEILRRFAVDICGARADWVMRDYIEEAVQSIRQQVGSEQVILGLSGGVDSAVSAALIARAIGAQLTCVFVDHGLLRLNEVQQVLDAFAEQPVKIVHVDASATFMQALAGVADPEQKRKIIGRLFVEVFTAEAKKIQGANWLAQGTIYPDVIESGAHGRKAAVIKSHHNVGGLPEQLGLKLLEPLRQLFKDEVRALGLALGLPRSMVMRHPFPGPGLGVRILGEV
ncbi:MAG: glutamine-hydrolyzing GMP synthase, partial [Ottowia sp.]|nr:glutamine-hydrolyzing GMP synthase [Ottowia sp.]